MEKKLVSYVSTFQKEGGFEAIMRKAIDYMVCSAAALMLLGMAVSEVSASYLFGLLAALYACSAASFICWVSEPIRCRDFGKWLGFLFLAETAILFLYLSLILGDLRDGQSLPIVGAVATHLIIRLVKAARRL